jgi:hypothetical protein
MHDVKDSRGVPVSAGIPPIVVWAVIFTVVVIFAVGGACIFGSNYHHIWPSSDTTHIKLD